LEEEAHGFKKWQLGLQYHDKGRLPAVKQQIIDMTLNDSGVRDIVRVLRVSSATVIDVLKKKSPRSHRSTNVC
jgi:transposase-like protein